MFQNDKGLVYFVVRVRKVVFFICYADLVIVFKCVFGFMKENQGFLGLSLSGVVILGFMQVVVGLLFISYFLSVCTNPGATPRISYLIESEDIRYCEICDQPKPPRTHHCRKCKICIHRMDHHCIWINNCVGYKNHKYFLLFLTYLIITGCISLYPSIYAIACSFNSKELKVMDTVLIGIVCLECVFFIVIASMLLKDQIYNLMGNQSSIEKFNRKYGLDMGRLKNLEQVLGTNKLLWLVPCSPDLDVNFDEPLINFSQRVLEARRNLVSPECD